MDEILQKKSKELSYLLRHNPKELNMDKNGYVIVSELLQKINITMDELEKIVLENDKKRFSFKDSKKEMIRANQGHSIKVDVELKAAVPPVVLYHGTSPDSYDKIKKSGGLSKMNRLHVHLTDREDVAYSVGKRYSKRDKPVILKIDAAAMWRDNIKFYKSENDVWLTDSVPIKYIKTS